MLNLSMHLRSFAVALMALTLQASTAFAQTPAEFYKGKTVRVIVSTTAGGGYDLRARLLARYMGKYIPGNPNLVVENMPGGGSVVAMNYTYNVAPHDGTAICMFQRSIFTTPLLTPQGIKFDLARFNWLGNVGAENGVVAVWHDAPARTTEELFSKEVIVGMPGATVIPTVFNALIGTKFKIINGYPGQAEIITALERGEVQGVGEWSWSDLKTNRSDWLRDKKINLLLQIATIKSKELPDVPLAQQFAKNDEDRKILDIFTSQRQLAFPLVLPPDTPADRVKALRDAFMKVAGDADYIADMQKLGAEVDFTSGEQATEFVQKTFGALSPELAVRINAFGIR